MAHGCDHFQAVNLRESYGLNQNLEHMGNDNGRTQTAIDEEQVTPFCTHSPNMSAICLPCVSVLPGMQIKADGQEGKLETVDEHATVPEIVTM